MPCLCRENVKQQLLSLNLQILKVMGELGGHCYEHCAVTFR